VAPEAGELLLEGRPLAAVGRRESARRIAYLPQSLDFVFPIQCLDFVLQGRAPHAKGFSADSAEDRERAIAAMRACDVERLADRDAAALSGGERRRVFLARALAQDAEIWLLDEPTSGLDLRHRLEFLGLLDRTHAERGTTVLLVTHEIDLAGDLADRVILLRRGRALAVGRPDQTLTPDRVREAFGVESRIEIDGQGRRRVVPYAPAG
jgi:iron complex transport system ATP-binding protein